MMDAEHKASGFEMIYAIVNNGLGSKVLHTAKESGVTGGTILLGTGTIDNPLLERLALCDIQREIVMMAAPRHLVDRVLEDLNSTHHFHKKNHGIAYSIPIYGICGSSSCQCDTPDEYGGLEETMYQSIIAIVDKGKAEAVVEAATQAGARGATIINARGSGIHETSRVFAMEIEPEKEIVMMVTSKEMTERIIARIQEEFQIQESGKGIVFVQNVSKAYGLSE